MNNSKIDKWILDGGWKGTVTRIIGMALVFLGMKFLPDVFAWLSAHAGVSPMSVKQTEQHRGILAVFKIVFGFALLFELIRSLYVFLTTPKVTGN